MMTMTGCGRELCGLPCCTVIHGDCNDYLWMLYSGIDIVLTDPPYGMNFVSGFRKETYAPIVGDDHLPTETIQKLISIPRLGSYFFCRWDNLWDHGALPKPKSVITWLKPGGFIGDIYHEHGRTSELALFYAGQEHAFKKRPSDAIDMRDKQIQIPWLDVVDESKTRSNLHPTEKPVKLIKQMLQWYDFDTVLDPYMGSGTTALAAMSYGRNSDGTPKKHFLGFEVDDIHFATARDRINAQRGIVGNDPDSSQPTLDFSS
jgi:site-specific DNA-methyltransferase (adenine-specific)